MPATLRNLLVLFGAFFSLNSHAGNAQGGFMVSVKLIGTGLCVNTTLSQLTNAIVRVTCQGNQFVSIEPRKGRPFLGVHGGAFRFVFSSGAAVPGFLLGDSGGSSNLIGQGTITALRVLDLTERDGKLEFLVSF